MRNIIIIIITISSGGGNDDDNNGKVKGTAVLADAKKAYEGAEI